MIINEITNILKYLTKYLLTFDIPLKKYNIIFIKLMFIGKFVKNIFKKDHKKKKHSI